MKDRYLGYHVIGHLECLQQRVLERYSRPLASAVVGALAHNVRDVGLKVHGQSLGLVGAGTIPLTRRRLGPEHALELLGERVALGEALDEVALRILGIQEHDRPLQHAGRRQIVEPMHRIIVATRGVVDLLAHHQVALGECRLEQHGLGTFGALLLEQALLRLLRLVEFDLGRVCELLQCLGLGIDLWPRSQRSISSQLSIDLMDDVSSIRTCLQAIDSELQRVLPLGQLGRCLRRSKVRLDVARIECDSLLRVMNGLAKVACIMIDHPIDRYQHIYRV